MQQSFVNSIEKVCEILKNSKYLVITAGAGIGVDSGMPDFRGPQGFWNTFVPFKDKFTFQDCANPSFLRSHPRWFWGFYAYRLDMYRKLDPHYGFQILKKISQRQNFKDYFIITSNVDGHFQKSGFDENKILEVHGTINKFQCGNCNKIVSADNYPEIPFDTLTFEATEPLPRCIHCQSQNFRPNILMFGDWEWQSNYAEEQQEKYDAFLKNINRYDQICVLEIGAGLAVSTIRNIGESLINDNFYRNGHLVRLNLRDIDPPRLLYDSSKYIAIKDTSLNGLKQIEKSLFP